MEDGGGWVARRAKPAPRIFPAQVASHSTEARRLNIPISPTSFPFSLAAQPHHRHQRECFTTAIPSHGRLVLHGSWLS